MPIIIPPGFGQLAVKFRSGSGNRDCINVFGVKLDAPPTQTDLDNVCAALGTTYKTIVTSAGSFTGVDLLVGQDGPDSVFMTSVTGAGAGGTTTETVPPQVQILVKKTTALAGRHNRGRTFWPDLQETLVSSGGALTGATVSGYQTRANDIVATLGLGSAFGGMVLLHQVADRQPTPVTNYIVQSKVATLRPRFDR